MQENIKWLERVEFESSETIEANSEPNKLILWNSGNGDLYIGIAPKSHRSCYTHYLRIERSGGASTRNPRLVKALTEAYHAIAENDTSCYPVESRIYCTWSHNSELTEWSGDCGVELLFKGAFSPEDNGFKFCHSCGKRILIG